MSPFLNDSPDAYRIVDNSVQAKKYARKMEMVKRQWSGNEGGLVDGIAIVNLVHSDGDDYLPVDFRIPADFNQRAAYIQNILQFDIPLPASTESDLRNPDKEQLRADILVMRVSGMSYRQIARAVGLHWTRVQQIVKANYRH